MVDLGTEKNLGGDHRVLVWEEKLKSEETAFIGGVRWASNLDVEVSEVGLGRLSVDADN